MSITMPAKIVSIIGQIATVEQKGMEREVLLAVPQASVGDFALVYGNAVIALISEAEASESTALITRLEEAARRA